MKKLLISMCLIALSFSVVQGEPNDVNNLTAITFRVMSTVGTDNTDLEFWGGFRKNDSEAGFIVGYLDEQSSEDSSMTIGGFSMFHFGDIRPLIENTFFPIEWLPTSIVAEPAVGMSITYNLDTSTIKTSPFVALRVYKTLELHVAYQDLNNEDVETGEGLKIGLSSMWRF